MTTTIRPEHPDSASAPPALRLVRSIENETGLDPGSEVLDRIAEPLADSAAGPSLSGQRMGHAVHPFLSDLPLGCWTSAALLDLVGGRSARTAARRLTGIGILGAVPTALSGIVEFDRLEERPTRRVATAHAIGNSMALGCQVLSWRARRKERQVRGVAWGLAGNALAAAAGMLGGHLAFVDGVGVGRRSPGSDHDGGDHDGRDHDDPDSDRDGSGATGSALRPDGSVDGAEPPAMMSADDLLDGDRAAEELSVTPDRLDEMIAQGLLAVAPTDDSNGRRFRRSDVEALRLAGG